MRPSVTYTGDFEFLKSALRERQGETAKLFETERARRSGGRAQGRLGNASDLILFAETHDIVVIVMGAYGRRGLRRLVLGSKTDGVMGRASCPVMVITNPSHHATTTGPDRRHRLNRLLYGISRINPAQEYSISLADDYDAELAMLHVAEGAPDRGKAHAVMRRA